MQRAQALQTKCGRPAGLWSLPAARQRVRSDSAGVSTRAFRTVHVIRPLADNGSVDGCNPSAEQVTQLAQAFAALSPRPEMLVVAPHERCLHTAAALVAAGRSTQEDAGPLAVEAEPLLRSRRGGGGGGNGGAPDLVVASRDVAARFPGVSFPASMAEDGWWRDTGDEGEEGTAGDSGRQPAAVAREPALAVAGAAAAAGGASVSAVTATSTTAVAVAEAEPGESQASFAHRLVRLRQALADRPARVLALVAEDEQVVAAVTRGGGASGSDGGRPGEAEPFLKPGQLTGTVRMELFCSRCRCGACWAPAKW